VNTAEEKTRVRRICQIARTGEYFILDGDRIIAGPFGSRAEAVEAAKAAKDSR
jgi:hypothetical protein